MGRKSFVCLALFAILGAALPLLSADQQDNTRSLSGQVMTSQNEPLPNAIVYLKNQKTLGVRTFVAEADGGYRFGGLSPNVDYQVYAEYQGKRSDTKTLSSFDSRKKVVIHLRIDPAK
ncbi:MAG TPA: carboxypeptidase-like regulatory domain-containing protein [Terriglobales bacterium]|nr:carboxypeptidase-like regulatory domain-containing protein [Terriglobales bacterium]